MHPDDEVPEADDLADAARRAFHRLSDGAAADLSWPAVQTRARRVQRTRVATAIAAAVVVLVGIGATIGTVQHDSDHLSIAGRGDTSTTSTTSGASTTTAAPLTTTPVSTRPAPPVTAPPPTTNTTPVDVTPAPVAQPADLTGSISLERTTFEALTDRVVRLTLHNVSDHDVSLPTGTTTLALYLGDRKGFGFDYATDPAANRIAPGQDRTYSTRIVMDPFHIGPAEISAAFVTGLANDIYANPEAVLTGVPAVRVKIVPPGRSPGDALDPSQGSWNVAMTADASEVAAGDTVLVHANITNTGTVDQETASYGSLAIACGAYPTLADYPASENAAGNTIADATLTPGATRYFSFRYRPPTNARGTVYCSVGLAFLSYTDTWTRPHAGLVSDAVTINVLPPSATTTTRPAPTPSTTP